MVGAEGAEGNGTGVEGTVFYYLFSERDKERMVITSLSSLEGSLTGSVLLSIASICGGRGTGTNIDLRISCSIHFMAPSWIALILSCLDIPVDMLTKIQDRGMIGGSENDTSGLKTVFIFRGARQAQ